MANETHVDSFMVHVQYTVATDELLCLKNAATQISMFFTSNELLAPMAIEKKSKFWEPIWSYQLNSTANLAHLAHFLGVVSLKVNIYFKIGRHKTHSYRKVIGKT